MQASGAKGERSGHKDDLPADVALREQPAGIPYLGERKGRGHLDLQLAGDQLRQLGEYARAGTCRPALDLDSVPCHGVEAEDRVDAGRLNAKLQRELPVVRAEGIDEGVDLSDDAEESLLFTARRKSQAMFQRR